jgi:hypothetical protein
MPKPHSQPTPPSLAELSSSDASKISRRSFGRHAATVAALSLSPATLLAAPHDSRPESRAEARLEPTQDVEAKLANIIRKYGGRLSGAQREHLRRILIYNEKMLASVRAFSLQNGDPPASVLRVSFARETTAPGTRRAVASKNSHCFGEAEEGKI